MGLLDDILSKLGRAPRAQESASAAKPSAGAKPSLAAKPAAAAKPAGAAGPLRLAPGDHVSRYRDRFQVVGTRCLDGGSVRIWHYCLRDAAGGAAVLSTDEQSGGECSLQRKSKSDAKWDADAQSDPADGATLKLARRGRANVRAWNDAGAATTTKSVEFREYADAARERVMILEDWQGAREARVGDVLLDSELTFERAAEGAGGGKFSVAAQRAGLFEDAADDDVVKGTPRAAARALEQNVGATKSTGAAAKPDRDPTAYEDDAWADAQEDVDAAPAAKRKAAAAAAPATDEMGDGWGDAARLIRGPAGAGPPSA